MLCLKTLAVYCITEVTPLRLLAKQVEQVSEKVTE